MTLQSTRSLTHHHFHFPPLSPHQLDKATGGPHPSPDTSHFPSGRELLNSILQTSLSSNPAFRKSLSVVLTFQYSLSGKVLLSSIHSLRSPDLPAFGKSPATFPLFRIGLHHPSIRKIIDQLHPSTYLPSSSTFITTQLY